MGTTGRKGGRRTRDERSASSGACAVVRAVHWRWDELSAVMKMAHESSGMKMKMKTSLDVMGGRVANSLAAGERHSALTEQTK